MSDKMTLKPIAVAIGTTFAISLAASPVINAAENPFSVTAYESGYMVAEGKCGDMKDAEGKCGEGKGKAEGKCGEGKDKDMEGKCGEGKDMEGKGKAEGKCGDSKKTKKEGKCGEGKCGDKK